MDLLELGRLRFASVSERLLNVFSRIKLRRLLNGSFHFGLSVVTRENAAVLGLNCPQTSLVVHLRARVFAYTPDQIRVTANFRGPLLRRRHLFSLFFFSVTNELQRGVNPRWLLNIRTITSQETLMGLICVRISPMGLI